MISSYCFKTRVVSSYKTLCNHLQNNHYDSGEALAFYLLSQTSCNFQACRTRIRWKGKCGTCRRFCQNRSESRLEIVIRRADKTAKHFIIFLAPHYKRSGKQSLFELTIGETARRFRRALTADIALKREIGSSSARRKMIFFVFIVDFLNFF